MHRALSRARSRSKGSRFYGVFAVGARPKGLLATAKIGGGGDVPTPVLLAASLCVALTNHCKSCRFFSLAHALLGVARQGLRPLREWRGKKAWSSDCAFFCGQGCGAT